MTNWPFIPILLGCMAEPHWASCCLAASPATLPLVYALLQHERDRRQAEAQVTGQQQLSLCGVRILTSILKKRL